MKFTLDASLSATFTTLIHLSNINQQLLVVSLLRLLLVHQRYTDRYLFCVTFHLPITPYSFNSRGYSLRMVQMTHALRTVLEFVEREMGEVGI